MRVDEEHIRGRLNSHLDGQPEGAAARIAAAAGVSPSTVSRFRRGAYLGRSDRVAERLAGVLAEHDAAEAIASGKYRPAWLVRTRRSLRIVRRAETVEQIMARDHDACVIQIWLGPEPSDVHFVR